jgi:hypothetical protein
MKTVMSSVLSHPEMHLQHKRWSEAEALWQDESRVWLSEIDAALADFKKLESILREHRDALEAHVQTVGKLRQRRALHEAALADYEQGGHEEHLIELAAKHEREGEEHRRQYQAHERVKRHHHTVLAHWRLLFKALSKEM